MAPLAKAGGGMTFAPAFGDPLVVSSEVRHETNAKSSPHELTADGEFCAT
jgi:hypothetical protein